MKNLLTVVVIAAFGWYGFTKYQSYTSAHSADALVETTDEDPYQTFSCDGRTRCSQMNSCEEATYFVRNCPRVEMDGDGDGVPCESQWCRGG